MIALNNGPKKLSVSWVKGNIINVPIIYRADLKLLDCPYAPLFSCLVITKLFSLQQGESIVGPAGPPGQSFLDQLADIERLDNDDLSSTLQRFTALTGPKGMSLLQCSCNHSSEVDFV